MELKVEQYFKDRCKEELPIMLMVNGITYKLDAHGLMSGGYRITYAKFDGDMYNWNDKPIDLIYNIVDELPPIVEQVPGELKDSTIYKTSIDNLIDDCLDKLDDWHKGTFEVLDEIVPREEQFHRELTSLINKYSKENDSNTPDFILASYLTGCLRTFNSITESREKWYGRNN